MPGIERAAAVAFAGEPSIDPARTRTEADYARLIRKGHSLVAHVGEAMAGFLVAEPFSRELHIWEMDVAPAFQRRGIGAGLVRAAMIDARNTGFRALTLTTFPGVSDQTVVIHAVLDPSSAEQPDSGTGATAPAPSPVTAA